MRENIKKLHYEGGDEKNPFKRSRSRYKRIDAENLPTQEGVRAIHRGGGWPDAPSANLNHVDNLLRQHVNRPYSELIKKCHSSYRGNDLREVLGGLRWKIARTPGSIETHRYRSYEFYLDDKYVLRRVPGYVSWRQKVKYYHKDQNRSDATTVVLLDGKEVAFFTDDRALNSYLCSLTSRLPQPIHYHEGLFPHYKYNEISEVTGAWSPFEQRVKGLTVFGMFNGVWYEYEYRLCCYMDKSPWCYYERVHSSYKRGNQLGKKDLKKFNLPR